MNDEEAIDNLGKTFFGIFNNTNQKQTNWSVINHICIPETLVITCILLLNQEEKY
jgi:hypothetical protein